jgi:glycosyltransferase involved in cell wall biosynthesis
MTQPLFSIVTVTLNAEAELLRTVNSICNQNILNYEHIVKDGESTDSSFKTLPEDPRRRIIVRADEGIYDAMNQALYYCKGLYVVFLNAGDCFYGSNVLKDVSVYAQSQGYPNIIYTDYYNDRIEDIYRYPSLLSKTFLYRKTVCQQATFIKKCCYNAYGHFDLKYKFVADYEYLLRLLSFGEKAYHCPIIGITYKDCGYSALPQHSKILNKETVNVRRIYFSIIERFFYGMLWFLTFPHLRMWLLRRQELRVFWSTYIKFANWWNRNIITKN